jgi:hypothetical protein
MPSNSSQLHVLQPAAAQQMCWIARRRGRQQLSCQSKPRGIAASHLGEAVGDDALLLSHGVCDELRCLHEVHLQIVAVVQWHFFSGNSSVKQS